MFGSKEAFLTSDVEDIPPSRYNASHDCIICLDALSMLPDSTKTMTQPHGAVRIKSCRHVHGKECLSAWLDVGYSCPTCGWVLFIPPPQPTLSIRIINSIIDDLKEEYDEHHVTVAVLAIMEELEVADKKRRLVVESAIAFQALRVEEHEKAAEKDFAVNWEESDEEPGWYRSDDDEASGGEDDEDEQDWMGDETIGFSV
ncbi:hypothetical protein CC80DRAFT_572286 [Byssothecium circinans]|uniref:RING-type domain-containing protein n=1 Tax=Byssothecium circinans TaxID=147558 RepID=A0A6A5TUF0_9PLEO|nr:hypothetical protein CC80DRAFT_572286 [Byssothecium circinans]